ncbi:MAG: GTPase Era [Gemmatimonadota bacterium]
MNLDDAPDFHSGFVALVGLANVGKSTLVNALTGEKLSIVTARPQTTRQRVTAIFTTDEHQAVFIDTPGLLEPRYLLHESMQEEARGGAIDADVLVYVADLRFEPSVKHASDYAAPRDARTILCLNKSDRLEAARLEERVERFEREGRWEAVVPTVATTGEGIDRLRLAILERLPPGPAFYPSDELATAPMRFFVAEKIREVCFEELGEELPYSLAVGIEEYREGSDPLYIAATIYVERKSQKGMVIGKGGRMVRRIGIRAREAIEPFVGQRVYLDLRVKVLANWRKNPGKLKLLGYPVPSR